MSKIVLLWDLKKNIIVYLIVMLRNVYNKNKNIYRFIIYLS